MTLTEYERLSAERKAIISENRSRLMRKLEPLPVPPKPEHPKVRVAYSKDGTYEGVVPNDMEDYDFNPEWIIKLEDTLR